MQRNGGSGELMIDSDALRRAANAVRGLSIDAVQRANSGHPGMPLGMADAAVTLWSHFLQFDPGHPEWPDRDRFVLSAGHGSMLLYSLLHLSGFELSLEDIKEFRQLGSRTPGHPECDRTAGVETTTGPLGQGLANGVGMAIGERWLANKFNRPGFQLIDHYTYVVVGDGCLMEGISHEACSLAGHLGLGRLIVLWDDNGISIDGATSLASSDVIEERFKSYGWHIVRVDGQEPGEVGGGLAASREVSERPSLVVCETEIGYGSPNRAGTAKAHGEPLGEEEIRLTKRNLGIDDEKTFHVPEGANEPLSKAAQQGARCQEEWAACMERYRVKYPEEAKQFDLTIGSSETKWINLGLDFTEDVKIATRVASGRVLDKLCAIQGNLVGGSADLTGSNNTLVRDGHALQAGDFSGRYIHYGVREHAMAAVMNGMALHRGIVPYGGTFLVFSDYMRPAIRLAALMQLKVVFVFTHDSIGVGEDGPTHQPVEQLLSLRAIPGLTVIRPADAYETVEAWRVAVERAGPTALVLTRQKLPVLKRGSGSGMAGAEGLRQGAYILVDDAEPRAIIMGSGSEVHVALEAGETLSRRGVGVRVVSVPSWELYEETDNGYRKKVMAEGITPRVAVEAGIGIGWERYVGRDGAIVCLDRFGESGPGEKVFSQLGVTADAVVEAVEKLLAKS